MRLLSALGALGALGLLLVHGAQALGAAYERSATGATRQPAGDRTQAAALLAARLTPWHAERQALSARLYLDDAAAARAGYLKALRWATADALLWSEHARMRARNGDWTETELATRQANTLAPRSPAVQWTLATLAVRHWLNGSEALRSEWLKSLRYELRHNREPFLEAQVVRGQVRAFCTGPAPVLKATRWCQGLRREIRQCQTLRQSEAAVLCPP